MDVVLIILGILGFGAIVISAYVFTVAARNYVSEEADQGSYEPQSPAREGFVMRRGRDRRRGVAVQFPLTVNNVVVTRDRRQIPERRSAAA
ncbi:MAG: hypothetical protein ACRCVD_06130 [Halioglobus sp.]